MTAPIGIFDSGYGGLTVMRDIMDRLPQYDYIYLGDNARAPYGTRSFEIVHQFTLQAVERLFALGAPLVILACNTASAKALRTIQQENLPLMADPSRRVLGVIRPTVERVGALTRTGHVGVLGTPGTVASDSYRLELHKLYGSEISCAQMACPMWVPLVENLEAGSPGADYFVKKYVDELMAKDPEIDTIILGCTHYPVLIPKITQYLPPQVRLISQGGIVAESLEDYLARHPEMDRRLSRNGTRQFLTTETPDKFVTFASLFLNKPVEAQRITL